MPAVGVGFDVFSVAMNTATGNQALVGDCKGNSPRAALVFATWGTAIGTQADGLLLSQGLTDGTTTRCFASDSGSGQTAALHVTGRASSQSRLILVLDPATNALDGDATFVSFSADTLTINVNDAPTRAVLLMVVLFYGDDLEVAVGQLGLSAVQNNSVSVAGLSFAPNLLIGLAAINGFAEAAGAVQCRQSLGFAAKDDAGAIQQGGQHYYDRDTPTLSAQCAGAIRSDSFLQRVALTDGGALTDEARYEVMAWNADGVTITTRAGAFSVALGYLLMKTGSARAWVGSPAVDVTTTGSKPLTDPGWRPQFLMALGTGVGTINTNASDTTAGRLSIGAVANGTARCVSVGSEDSSTPSDTESLVDSKVLAVTDAASGILYDLSFTSFDALGFTLNCGTAAGSAKAFAFLAIEEDRKDAGWLPEVVKRRHRTLVWGPAQNNL
jgi:hypothetical protein